MNYYKMNVFKNLGINTLGELKEFVQWYNKHWKGSALYQENKQLRQQLEEKEKEIIKLKRNLE